MKKILNLLLSVCLCAAAAMAQSSTSTDVYHVMFTKAVPGQAVSLGDALKTQAPGATQPGHYLVLRHQAGDDWDYCVIEHLGTKATIDAAAPAPPNPARDFIAWHGDTFVLGPSWSVFAEAMGLSGGGGSTSNSAYVVAVWRAVPGQRDQLEKILRTPPSGKIQTGDVVLQHIEGGPWQYMAINRYNSWQEYGTDQADQMSKTTTGQWAQIRNYSTYHHDTLTDRIAPK